MAITELRGNLGQGAVVEEEGAKGFEASVQGCRGLSEEGAANGIIHGVDSEIVIEFSWRIPLLR